MSFVYRGNVAPFGDVTPVSAAGVCRLLWRQWPIKLEARRLNMHRTGIWILTIFLVACGGGGYNASGTWQGTATNQSYPYDSLAMRFYLNDQNGSLSGSHCAYLDGSWRYVGTIRGSCSGESAAWRVDASGGYIEVGGSFGGDRFNGTYRIVAYGSGSLTASLSLARGGTQSLNLPLEVGVLTRLLEELW
jgi:hypothetical protein